jgi:hypothetical protein
MLRLGYKIVTRSNNKLLSMLEGSIGSTEYKKYLWTYPINNNGPLAVCSTFFNAKDWYDSMKAIDDRVELWQCEYILAKRVKQLWYFSTMHKRVFSQGSCDTTVLAKAVRLLNQVEVKNESL